jgi:menaquinone-9 beta-reductase
MKLTGAHYKSKIAIVGAGPAGASAAIRLAMQGFRVSLIEREKFPRQKLCGEFISPECFAHFRELGVLDEMLAAGGNRITETVFYAPNGKFVSVPSQWFNREESALGLSRAEMDFRLLERARETGVNVLAETQVNNLLIENEKVCGVKAKDKEGNIFEIAADLTIDATGRARVLGKLAEKGRKGEGEKGRRGERERKQRSKVKDQRSKLVGFKAHLKNAEIEKGVCEIYFFRGGYGGLNYVENDVSNHCFLIRADVVREFNSDAQQIVEKVVFQNRRACETLKNASPIYDWLAVTVDGFGLKNLTPAPNLIAIGDAAAFIDPFTGSGMLMALESGKILTKAILETGFSAQKIAGNYKILHARKFQKRLWICSLLRRAAFAPHLARLAISALGFGDFPRKILARATRPGFSVSSE